MLTACKGRILAEIVRQGARSVDRVRIASAICELLFFNFTRWRPPAFISGFLMIKTRKSIAKKFKVTGSGKVMRRKAGHRHFLRNKTNKQKRGMTQDQPASAGVTRFVRIGAPNLF